MRTWLSKFTWIFVAWTVLQGIWEAIGHFGNFQTLWDIIEAFVKNWPKILQIAVWVVTSWWFPLLLSIACFVFWLVLTRPPRRTAKIDSTLAPTTPELRIESDPNINGCWSLNVITGGRSIKYLHAAVSVNIEQVTNCKAYLTQIAKGDVEQWNGQEQLTFSPSEASDALSKTIHHGITSFLDVLALTTDDNEIYLCNEHRQWLRWPRLRDIFAERAKYFLTISVAGEGVTTRIQNLVFDWTGNWQTAFLYSPHVIQAQSANILRPIEVRDILDGLIQRGRSLRDQWKTRLTDSVSKRRRQADCLLWLTEASTAVKKHLSISQFDEFNNYRVAMEIGERFTFSLKVLQAGTKEGSDDLKIAFEIASKLKILQRFRSEITQRPS